MSVKQIFNTSAELDYPTVLPTLDLDFANSKTLDPRITFTRASGGSYVGADGLIKLAGVNEPRFDHDPVTGESLGFLVEEARTNNLLYSEQFDNGYWTKDNTAVTSNAAIAPDGTLTADLLYTTTSGVAVTYRGIGGVASSTYTNTIYLKSAGFTWAFVYGAQGNIFAHFNLIAGTVGTVGAGVTASILPVGNGWYRCSVTQTVTSLSFHVGPADANGSTASTASGTSGIYAWGVQLEEGSFPTSYIPTEGSSRTRAADVASITGKNFSSWYNQSEGTIVTNLRNTIDKNFQFPWTISAGGSASSNISPRMQASAPRLRILFNFNGVSGVTGAIDTTFTTGKFALGFSGLNTTSTSLYYSENGASVSNNTFTNVVATNDTIAFGYYFNNSGAGYYNGIIARFTYYPKRLTDAQLQVLTT